MSSISGLTNTPAPQAAMNAVGAVQVRVTSTSTSADSGATSIWDVLEKLAKLKQEAIEKADRIADTMSADDDEATKAQKQRELAKAAAFIEDIQKKVEKMTEVAHTTSNSRL